MRKDEYVSNDTSLQSTVFGRHISWSAIVAGLVVAMISQVLLTLIGIAIGAASAEPVRSLDSLENYGAGAAMWWIVTSLISLFVGARVAGRMAGVTRKKDGALHGFLMWSTATIMTFLVAGSVLGGAFGGAFSALGAYQADNTMMSAQYQGLDSDDTRRGRNNSPEGNIDFRTDQQAGSSGAQMTATVDNDSATGTAGTTGRDNDDHVAARNTGGVAQDQTIGSTDLRDDAERAADATAKIALWALLGLAIGAVVSLYGGSRIGDHEEPVTARRRVSTEPVPHT